MVARDSWKDYTDLREYERWTEKNEMSSSNNLSRISRVTQVNVVALGQVQLCIPTTTSLMVAFPSATASKSRMSFESRFFVALEEMTRKWNIHENSKPISGRFFKVENIRFKVPALDENNLTNLSRCSLGIS